MTEEKKFHKLPELLKGIRIQFIDKDDKTRVERIHSRTGNTITVTNASKEKTRLKLDHVKGYWKPRVMAKYDNMIPLVDTDIQLRKDCNKQKRKEGLRQSGLLKCNECDTKECGI